MKVVASIIPLRQSHIGDCGEAENVKAVGFPHHAVQEPLIPCTEGFHLTLTRGSDALRDAMILWHNRYDLQTPGKVFSVDGAGGVEDIHDVH